MPEYSFSYEEIQVLQASFFADDNVQARGILESIQNGELYPQDIDTVVINDKAYELVVDTSSLYRTDGEDV